MQTFSPFDKDIRDLHPDDLAILKSVSEGWYVEYKKAVVSTRALAKAISAFANTYGGWLFLGVEQLAPDNPVAGSFPGIPENQLEAIQQRLRQSVAEYLSPTPHFETKIFRGPCSEIGLLKGKVLIAVEIPQSHTAPHVHKDGRIYRRVGDSSEPKPETDRFVLDQLWRRSEPIREMIRKWVKRDPEFSEAEAKVPYLRLLLCVDPWFQRDAWVSAPFSEIRRILNSHEIGIRSIAFDTVYPMTSGFIARHQQGNDPYNYVLTWTIRRDLSCDIVFPLPQYTPKDADILYTECADYKYVQTFIEILKEQGHTQPKIADLNYVMSVLISVVSKYRRLLKLADLDGRFHFKARWLNVWRLLPFIDIETVLSDFKEYGLPMSLDSNVTVPIGEGPESFKLIPEFEKEDGENEKEEVISIFQAHIIFALVTQAFGVTTISDDNSDINMIPYDELMATTDRAMIVQRNRTRNKLRRDS